MGTPRPYTDSLPLQIEEVELQGPGAGEVLVRVRAAGLCHSDLSTVNGDRPRPMPMVLGHEAAGEVVECGAGVSTFRPGDRVVMVFVPRCGACHACMAGRPGSCEPGLAANVAGTLMNGAMRLYLNGEAVRHHLGVSAYAEYCVVHQGSLVKVDSSLSFVEAALFGCAVLTGAGAVINTARPPAGATMAVIGLGGVGLNAVLAARLSGARCIVAIDARADKLELALRLGATHTFVANHPDLVTTVKQLTQGGVDYAFEFAGVSAAMELAWNMTRRNGTTVTASLPNPDEKWPLPHTQLTFEERTLKGSFVGGGVPAQDIARYIQLYQQGRLPVDQLLSEQLKLEEINLGFERLAQAATVRQMIVFD
jgi:alcohol dehydrogenase